MKTLDEINSEIFNLVKKEKEVKYNGLYRRLKINDQRLRISIAKLKNEYKLISVANQVLSLSKEGEKYKDFNSYIKSLKVKSFDWYKIIPIILTIFFGSCSVYYLKSNYDLKVNESNLLKSNDSLKYQLLIYKDSFVEINKKLKLLQLKPSDNTVLAKK